MNEGAYSIAKVITPRRDVDLFGATTVRIDHIAGKGASPERTAAWRPSSTSRSRCKDCRYGAAR